MVRRFSLLGPSLALLVALLVVSPALSALRIGTGGPDTLVGTNRADELTGKGGTDTLRGLAGDDVYFFRDGWGFDTIDDQKTYVVRGKRVSGGIDTLNFSRATRDLTIGMNIQQWGSSGQTVSDDVGNQVVFGTSVVEKAVGGQGADEIYGGGEANTLQPGAGGGDLLRDYGGWKEGAQGPPALPVSNDTYKGFADITGTVHVQDWGGSADVLDMRPFSIDDVYIDRIDTDDDPEEESLVIVLRVIPGNPPTDIGVIVDGQFGAYYTWPDLLGMHGQIEKLIFTDRTISPSATRSMAASAAAHADGGDTADLAAAAERMAAAARADLTQNPSPAAVNGGGDAGS